MELILPLERQLDKLAVVRIHPAQQLLDLSKLNGSQTFRENIRFFIDFLDFDRIRLEV
jgi:hypothetical protein